MIPVDVRIIADTNKDLYREVQEGRFRNDLFFRLSVLNMHLTPLRERIDDIPLLADGMLAAINRRLGCKVTGLDTELMRFLKGYSWPGNLRELQNVLESMSAVTKTGQIRYDAVGYVLEELEHRMYPNQEKKCLTLDDWERKAICEALAAENGNRSRAAERLEVDRSTLLRKLQKYGLK